MGRCGNGLGGSLGMWQRPWTSTTSTSRNPCHHRVYRLPIPPSSSLTLCNTTSSEHIPADTTFHVQTRV